MSILGDLRRKNSKPAHQMTQAELDREFAELVNPTTQPVRPRDINRIADEIDACDAEEQAFLSQLADVRDRRSALRTELAECCDGIVDQAQRIRERYIGGKDANICGNDDMRNYDWHNTAPVSEGSGQASPVDLSEPISGEAGVSRQEAEISPDPK